MSYLKFDSSKLVNLEYSLAREVLRANRAGSYLCTTISGCNTRKYHGLLVCPLPQLDGDNHVLLSSFDETVIQHGAEFNLGIHRYEGGHYEPKGHKYIVDFDAEMIPKTTSRVGGVLLSKERLLVGNETQALIRYTLVDAFSPTVLRFRPFLAFRNVHSLSKANMYANTKYHLVENGIMMRLYEGYPWLYMQFSGQPEFIAAPDWYNNIEYLREKERGYEYLEDLLVPGYFEIPIKQGESIIFSASTVEADPRQLKTKFEKEFDRRIYRNSFLNCLTNSAMQFIVYKEKVTDMIAGFPWYKGITRQTFVALPGLTLCLDDIDTFEQIIDTQLALLKDGLFPKITGSNLNSYDDIDAPLWFFWALQQYALEIKDGESIWKKYGAAMKSILKAYKNGTLYNIKMNNNGLVSGDGGDVALTWMDSSIDGKPVVPRKGMTVEVNALWYNAVCFALKMAEQAGDDAFVAKWKKWPGIIAKSFISEFWNEELGYTADFIYEGCKDWTVRPNMIIAVDMDFTPLTREMRKSILSIVKKQLLTPRGLRSLTPEDPNYKGTNGGIAGPEAPVHQGMAWPWLIQFFVGAYLKIHKKGGMSYVRKIIDDFEADMSEHCIGTIAEMYDGDPPHQARGAISQAWSVGAVIRANKLAIDFDASEGVHR